MKPGIYDMRLSADGRVAEGAMTIDGVLARSDGAQVTVHGEITRDGTRVIGALTVEVEAGFLKNTRIQRLFALSMTGVGTETEFSLWGLGPLGLIVEIVGVRREPPLASG